jgi:hypothetical protein
VKCVICADEKIRESGGQLDFDASDLPDAVVTAPAVQQFTAGGQPMWVPVVIEVCLPCRKSQLGLVSRTGLQLG